MKNNSGATQAPKLENAIADMKRQLRLESKATLIKQWIGMYAQIIKQAKEISDLKSKLSKNVTEQPNENLKSEPSGSEVTGADASKEVK